jgi:TRAP transporter TAXI family solute receptor
LPDLRLVLTILPFALGILVRNDSDIKTISDMKGRKFPVDWQAFPNGVPLSIGVLASVGLTLDDLKGVPTSGLIPAANDFKAGKTDGTLVAAGAPVVAEVNAAIKGGVRFLSLPKTPDSLARLKRVRPEYDVMTVQPSPRLAGVIGPTNPLRVDLTVATSAKVADSIVYKFVKAMYENKKELTKEHPSFHGYFPDERMAKQYSSATYHPAAIKFYTEKGIWPGK